MLSAEMTVVVNGAVLVTLFDVALLPVDQVKIKACLHRLLRPPALPSITYDLLIQA